MTTFTDDILHARIQTMGVTEHVFDVNIHGKATTWHIYDVGGARGQRHSWIPYFDDCNAIIFVAPISAFDQVRVGS
jgi:guanine nucleotide-binding protein alpha-1 subunit